MADKPLDLWQLERIAAAKAWEDYRKVNDPKEVPPAFYKAVSVVIKESYLNVDKMILTMISQRLEELFKKDE
jgi:hypothetical protein